MNKELIREFNTKNYGVKIELVQHLTGSFWFNELYEASEHIAGTTIQVPDHLQTRNSNKHYIGQTKPSELAKEYHKQGRKNPSYEAYKSLQDELAHYIEADDCSLLITISKGGLELSETYSVSFDWSYDYCGDIEEYWNKSLKKDYFLDCLREAIKEARESESRIKEIIAA